MDVIWLALLLDQDTQSPPLEAPTPVVERQWTARQADVYEVTVRSTGAQEETYAYDLNLTVLPEKPERQGAVNVRALISNLRAKLGPHEVRQANVGIMTLVMGRTGHTDLITLRPLTLAYSAPLLGWYLPSAAVEEEKWTEVEPAVYDDGLYQVSGLARLSAPRGGERRIAFDFRVTTGDELAGRYSATAWLDPKDARVLRLEGRYQQGAERTLQFSLKRK
jgi:hypothetical protein